MRSQAGPVAEIFHMSTPVGVTGTKFFDKVASLSPRKFCLEFHPSQPGSNFPYEQTTKFVPVTKPAWLPGSYHRPLVTYIIRYLIITIPAYNRVSFAFRLMPLVKLFAYNCCLS